MHWLRPSRSPRAFRRGTARRRIAANIGVGVGTTILITLGSIADLPGHEPRSAVAAGRSHAVEQSGKSTQKTPKSDEKSAATSAEKPKSDAKPGGSRFTNYTVKRGDTLTGVATRYGLTVRELAVFNDRKTQATLLVGTTLRIPTERNVGLPRAIRANPDRLALRTHTRKWAQRNNIPQDLLEAVLFLESGFNQRKISPDGAIGIGQLMPNTARYIARELIGKKHAPNLDPYKAEDNIRMSARYLRYLLRKYGGNERKALHAYYQGHGSISARGLYDDTIQYARNVQALRKRFKQ